ncbi:hypothetical protein [Pseudalkalibacillus hwajinpoensis]|uniref:hypothetical protein n=1 Tax=Guptibacillus hwajinpoensis TaxID=208199 RepID=UPI001CD4AC64|nr:hypothetical protein [Pseudalkalibacillus hwajinpoensis]MCA0990389.1 hypothetical protein [Pseudalkalibacillus hwajinpoensis]
MKRKRHYLEDQLLRESLDMREYRKYDSEMVTKKRPVLRENKKKKPLIQTLV